MATQVNKYGKVPRYHGLRIYLVSTVLYFFLVFPVAGILLFKYVPDLLENAKKDNPESTIDQAVEEPARTMGIDITTPVDSNRIQIYHDSTVNIAVTIPGMPGEQDPSNKFDNKEGRSQMGDTMGLLIRLLSVSFLIGFVFNLPFKLYFRNKRTLKLIKPKTSQYCTKFLLKTPIINVGILFLSYGITIIYMLYIILMKNDVDSINRQFYLQFFFHHPGIECPYPDACLFLDETPCPYQVP